MKRTDKMKKYLQYETLFKTKKGFVYYDRKRELPFVVAIGDNPDEGYFKTLNEAKQFLKNFQ